MQEKVRNDNGLLYPSPLQAKSYTLV